MEILLYVLVFVVVGAVMYFADRHWGAPFYRWCWNWCHKIPLSEGMERGFIVGRTTRERVLPAVMLTFVACLVLSRLGEHDAVTLFLKGTILMFPGILIGFLVTGLAMRENKTRTVADKVFQVMDDIESGKVDLKDVAQGALGQAGELGQRVVDAAKEKVVEAVTPAQPPSNEAAPQPEEVPVSPKPKRSFKDTLNDYSRRR